MNAKLLRHLAGIAVWVTATALTMAASPAWALPMKFDLFCGYVKVSGHEVWTGFPHNPYRGPRVLTEHDAIDLGKMTQRSLNHGMVPVTDPLAKADKTEIRLLDTPYIKMIVRLSDRRFTRIDVQQDNSRLIFKGRCRFEPFTPPGPPGQAYRGW